jgi:bifunctional DNA-binding transcriptional regulator/antitoxin component of YhaV-PrlF toxin-antitoxin module
MSIHFAKITSKAQTTVPAAVRKALKAGPGDTLAYRIGPEGVLLTRAEPLDWDYLRSLQTTLGEWNTAEDAAAFNDL